MQRVVNDLIRSWYQADLQGDVILSVRTSVLFPGFQQVLLKIMLDSQYPNDFDKNWSFADSKVIEFVVTSLVRVQ